MVYSILVRAGASLLRRYFAVVHGSELDGRNSAKGDLIAHILTTEKIDPARRKFDLHFAHSVILAGLEEAICLFQLTQLILLVTGTRNGDAIH